MEFRILGPGLEVIDDNGWPVPVSQSLIRAAITALLLHEGQRLTRTELMELIWSQPPTGGALRTCLYDVRKVIGPSRLVWEGGTYRLVLGEPDRTDLAVFRETVRDAQQALKSQELESAADLLDQALRLWDDRPLRDLPDSAAATEAAENVVEELRRARDILVSIRIELGHHNDLIDLLEGILKLEPLNDEAWGHLMLALYLDGRRAEALHAYYRARMSLEDAGIEPDEHLRELRQQIRDRDPDLGVPVERRGRTFHHTGERSSAWRLMPVAEQQASVDVDLTRAAPARVYDWLLGGKDNFAVDREAGARLLEAQPLAAKMARANRGFLERAVRTLAEAGVRQFLDLGTGIPTSPNVHEIAKDIHPDARIIYVDNDPIVASHNQALRAGPGVVSVLADVRDPAALLADPTVTNTVDTTEPVAVLMLALLHFISDEDDPQALVAAYRDWLKAGDFLAISTPSTEGYNDAELARITITYRTATAPVTIRSSEAIAAFFGGWPLLPPGLVEAGLWRADGPELRGKMLAGIAKKPRSVEQPHR